MRSHSLHSFQRLRFHQCTFGDSPLPLSVSLSFFSLWMGELISWVELIVVWLNYFVPLLDFDFKRFKGVDSTEDMISWGIRFCEMDELLGLSHCFSIWRTSRSLSLLKCQFVFFLWFRRHFLSFSKVFQIMEGACSFFRGSSCVKQLSWLSITPPILAGFRL